MNTLEKLTKNYLNFCQYQKRLDEKTLKAYRIDLKQFTEHLSVTSVTQITPDILEAYISMLHQTYKPKTSKRKIASVKAFFHYLEYKDFITVNPINKIQTKFREPITLPKIIPLYMIEAFLSTMYNEKKMPKAVTRKNASPAILPLLSFCSQQE